MLNKIIIENQMGKSMNKLEFFELLERYEKGETNPEENEILSKFLDSFQNGSDEWIEEEMGNQKEIEDKLYSSIKSKIHNKEISFWKSGRSAILKIAASIVLFAGVLSGVLFFKGVFSHTSSAMTWNEKSTQIGEKSILTFLDGTKITLNAGSKIKYPTDTDRNLREVYLEGEAYFEVAKDPSRPYLVHSQNITTTVLGTSFNVQAFPEENEIMVSLVEGNVKVSRTNENITEDMVMLNPTQQLIYSKKNDISIVESFDYQESVGWKDNVIKFNDEPLQKAFIKLERFYGVKFELTNKSKADLKITANFKDDSFKTVAEVIKKLTGLKYKTITEKNNVIKRIVFY